MLDDANPQATLAEWERTRTSIDRLRTELERTLDHGTSIDDVVRRAIRSLIVDPHQPVHELQPCLARAIAADRGVSDERLAVVDLVNLLGCGGVPVAEADVGVMRAWLPGLLDVGPPLAKRIRVGLAGLALGIEDVALGVAPAGRTPFVGGEAFPGDSLGILGYLITAGRVGATTAGLARAWQVVGEQLTELCADGQLDEPTLLWLARVIYERAGKQPVTRVAELAHDFVWRIPGAIEEAARERAQSVPEFPITDTLANGAFRIERLLRGRGAQQLYLGRAIADGAAVIVAVDDYYPQKQNIDDLRRLLSYRAPGIFELVHVGCFDVTGDPTRDVLRAGRWTTVEKVTAGSWLPHILGPADPWNAPRKAIDLARTAGRILLGAAKAGVILSHVRPELMWAERRDDRYAVTGLSARAIELFSRKGGEMVTHPVFDRCYHAPEIDDSPDDRAVAYALAVMTADWATGVYPFASRVPANGVETAAHLPITGPRLLAELLERTIRRNRNDRPTLASFVAELDGIAGKI